MNYNLTELKWIAMDLDGTLAFTKPEEDFSLDKAQVNYPLVQSMKRARKKGKRFIIYTSRHWDDYPVIEKWLHKHRVPFKFIMCGKPLVDKYVDDRNLSPDEFTKLWEEK